MYMGTPCQYLLTTAPVMTSLLYVCGVCGVDPSMNQCVSEQVSASVSDVDVDEHCYDECAGGHY